MIYIKTAEREIYIVKRCRDTAAQEILVELLQSFRWHGLRQVLVNFCQVLAKIGTRCCSRIPEFSSEPPDGIKIASGHSQNSSQMVQKGPG